MVLSVVYTIVIGIRQRIAANDCFNLHAVFDTATVRVQIGKPEADRIAMDETVNRPFVAATRLNHANILLCAVVHQEMNVCPIGCGEVHRHLVVR